VGFAGHTGQMDLLYCDGHAKSKRPTATVSSKLEWVLNVNTANPADCVPAGETQAACQALIDGMRRIEVKYQ